MWLSLFKLTTAFVLMFYRFYIDDKMHCRAPWSAENFLVYLNQRQGRSSTMQPTSRFRSGQNFLSYSVGREELNFVCVPMRDIVPLSLLPSENIWIKNNLHKIGIHDETMSVVVEAGVYGSGGLCCAPRGDEREGKSLYRHETTSKSRYLIVPIIGGAPRAVPTGRKKLFPCIY
jgi:hypothetical protein